LVATQGDLVHRDRATEIVKIRYDFAYEVARIRDHPFRNVTDLDESGFGVRGVCDHRFVR
jgi:hypothetical protein